MALFDNFKSIEAVRPITWGCDLGEPCALRHVLPGAADPDVPGRALYNPGVKARFLDVTSHAVNAPKPVLV
ncbi:MAG: hypothetical protein ABSE96_16765 [Terracidiphilus sp.]